MAIKNFILTILLGFCFCISPAQNIIVQIEQMETAVQNQGNLILVSSTAEPMNGIDQQDGLTIVSGFYPAALFDTTETSGIDRIRPIEDLQIAPNPTISFVTLYTSYDNHPEFKVFVYDASGAQLRVEHWPALSPVYNLRLEGIPSGTFYVHVVDDVRERASVCKVLKH